MICPVETCLSWGTGTCAHGIPHKEHVRIEMIRNKKKYIVSSGRQGLCEQNDFKHKCKACIKRRQI
jgi:hypothetical protein